MLVYSVTETVDIAYLLLPLCVLTVHVVEFGHFANSSYSWQQNIINFYNELNKHSLHLGLVL